MNACIHAFNAAETPLERGATLIEASAGTGKTYSLAALYLRLVLEEGAPVAAILAVTYTTAATQELRERIRALLHTALAELKNGAAENPVVTRYLAEHADKTPGVRALELAAQSFDEAQIFTIHGFCQRMLQEHAFESGIRYGAELLTDSRPLLEEVAADFWRTRFADAPALLAALALTAGISPEGWADLLGKTRNHPNLALLPEPAGTTCASLAVQLEGNFAAIAEAWRSGGAALTALLQADKALKPSERQKRLALLPVLERLGTAEAPAQELMEALALFGSTAIEKATGSRKTPPSSPFFALCEHFGECAEIFFQQLTREFLTYAEVALAARKRERNVLTYDDLLTRLHAALHAPHGAALAQAIGGKYQAALIDEFQDTDPLQYALFRRIFANGSHWLFWIGDPKQAIYGFRGADVFTYLSAAASASRRYTLETNWRSDQALLEGFNAFFLGAEDPFLEQRIRYYPVFSPNREIPADQRIPLQFRYLRSEEGGWNLEDAARRIADAAAADAACLHAGGGWEWRDLAVLVRTHQQAGLIQAALRQRGIRSVLHAEESVFRTPHAAELARVLEAVLAPGDNGRLHAALSLPLFALSGNALAGLGDAEHQQWAERFAAWRTLWREEGFAAMFRRLAATADLRRRVMEQPGGERRLTNLLHLAELLQEAQSSVRLTPEALLEWLNEQRGSSRAPAEAAQLRLESDGDAVQVVTVHKSKGLEYNVVLCPFLWTPADTSRRSRVQFHDNAGRLTLDLRGKRGAAPEAVAAHGREALAEEMRLLYVAVTRARKHCVIYAGDIQQQGVSALGHLLGEPMLAGIETLAATLPERIACTFVEPEAALPAPPPEPVPERPLAARIFPGAIHVPAFLTSFTGLTAGTSREEPERDEPLPERPAPLAIPPPAAPPDGIFRFEKGARAGEFFHEVLESLDFQHPEQLADLIPAKLSAHGLSNAPFAGAVAAKLEELLEVELAPGLRLRDVPMQARLSEAEFSVRLPVLRPGDLRALFADAGDPALDPEALGRLRFQPVSGFLRGFIDLFFEHAGKYYLVDWKSNWLGPRPEDYDLPGIEAAMRSHHYALQAHLYVLATDRFLAARVPGYAYETHFGGVFYLFLRGVERGNPQRGIYRARPPLALVEKLRALTALPTP